MKLLKISSILFAIFCTTTSFADHHMPKTSFGWYGVTGNFKQITPTKILWSGEFSGSMFADDLNSPLHEASIRCPGWQDMDFEKNTASLAGYCMVIDKKGNKASMEWTGTGTTNPPVTVGTWKWVSGDGPYADLAGKSGGKWRGMTVSNWPDGVATGVAYWNK